jgi:hypothetical protein
MTRPTKYRKNSTPCGRVKLSSAPSPLPPSRRPSGSTSSVAHSANGAARTSRSVNAAVFRVDQQIETISWPDPVDYAERMTRCFRYAFLGAHAFALSTGTAYCHLPEAVRSQRPSESLTQLIISFPRLRKTQGRRLGRARRFPLSSSYRVDGTGRADPAPWQRWCLVARSRKPTPRSV